MNFERRERDTSLVTLSVAKDSNSNSVVKQLRKEIGTAMNIKDSDTRKKVTKALCRLISEVSQTKVENGYIAFSAYNDI
jgi:peptide subunit release factor 1 (eRF1)